MKKSIRKTICLLAVLVMVMSTVAVASAETTPNVTYKGQAEKFIFEPGSDYSKTDLFATELFKGVMPGDKITDTIEVRNEASNKVNVEIFMRALGSTNLENPEDGNSEVSQEASDEFLQQMGLVVTRENGTVLFDAKANETAQLTDWVSLGTFESGEIADLNVALTVPYDMGNEFQYDLENGTGIGALDWQFKVVETPIPEEETKTGDDFNMMIPVGIAIAALVAAGILIATRKKHSR